jgi:hypothetical protein
MLPPGTVVRLQTEPATDRVDQYGWLLRYVIRVRDGLNVNVRLVAIGAAARMERIGQLVCGGNVRARPTIRLTESTPILRTDWSSNGGRNLGPFLAPAGGKPRVPLAAAPGADESPALDGRLSKSLSR